MKKANSIKMLIVLKTEGLNSTLAIIKRYRKVMSEKTLKKMVQYCQEEKEEILRLVERLRGETG